MNAWVDRQWCSLWPEDVNNIRSSAALQDRKLGFQGTVSKWLRGRKLQTDRFRASNKISLKAIIYTYKPTDSRYTNDSKLWWELTCAPLNPPQPHSLCSPSLLIKPTVLEWLLFQLPSNKWQPLSVMSSYGLVNTPFTNIRDRMFIDLANYWHF